jgi:hypothetical protein
LPHERCEICHHEAHGERCDFPGCACPDVASSSRFTWRKYGSAVAVGVILAVLAYGLVHCSESGRESGGSRSPRRRHAPPRVMRASRSTAAGTPISRQLAYAR